MKKGVCATHPLQLEHERTAECEGWNCTLDTTALKFTYSVNSPGVHKKPGSENLCAYLAHDFCNKCGWLSALAEPSEQKPETD